MQTDELIQTFEQFDRENKKTLDLSRRHIFDLPPEIGMLRKLEVLNLRGNSIKTLPTEIGQLKNLRFLNLRNNYIQELPVELFNLNNLSKLDMRTNRLVNIPNEISKLEQLTYLNIRENRLKDLPEGIRKLQNLNTIGLSGNILETIPSVVFELSQLIKIDLVTCGLSEISSEIQNLVSLEYINFARNLIHALPKEIQLLTNLRELVLTENLLPIPPEILEKTNEPKAILNFYFELKRYVLEEKKGVSKHETSATMPDTIFITGETGKSIPRPINEAKLILVGQGSVGKTSLIQQILYGKFNQNQFKTEGISISQWKFNMSQDIARKFQTPPFLQIETSKPLIINFEVKDIKLNIWDFGGQEIMHATHQFFLTKRSLYLLVLDSRLGQDENRVEYWLRIIQSYGGDSPIIVVGNKIDQQPLDIDRRGLQAKYPNIKTFIETSCLDGRGIEELKEIITNEISVLPHVRDLLPGNWFQVKGKLEKLDKDFIPFSEYEALCIEGGITDETSQSTLISFLHDLGSVLNFRDDPRLQETNILNPEWVTNGVYRILNSNELFQKKGVLETKKLGEMLNSKAYSKSRHMFIVDMMRKFELCYPFEGDEGKYLVPDLLPREEPFTGDWANALAFEFHYSVLPGSIISRFIVRMHPFIHQHTVWRAGVVLKSGDNLALVKADYEDKVIFIRVTGEHETRRDALAMVRGTLDAIHKTITGLEAAPKVPHPDYPELVLDYDELIEFEKQGIDSFPKKVGPQVVMVDVRQLLDGVEGKSALQVFISYAHEDKAFANKLAKSLKAAGLGVWKDDSNIQGGAAWLRQIQQGIAQSKLVINLLSQSSIDSEFVEKELIYAIDTAKKKVIPLRIKDVQPPLMLANLQYVDFYRKNYEKTFEDLLSLIRDNL